MRAQGAFVRVSPDLKALTALAPADQLDAIVVDVSLTGLAGVVQVAAMLPSLNAPVLVVGPDEDFDAMTRALELGLADYVPMSQRATLPRKLRRAVDRARKARR